MSKTLVKEIKTALDNNKIILGTKRTLKSKNLAKIIIAENCPDEIKNKLKTKDKITIETFNSTSIELGATCKKPFSVLVLSIKK